MGSCFTNLLIIGGDLNTSTSPNSPHTGQGVWPARCMQPDATQLEAILEAQHLSILNSWGRKNTAYTFVAPHSKTQVDFLIMRRHQADDTARRAKAIDSDLLQWRGGGQHRPVTACIPSRHFISSKPGTCDNRQSQKPNLLQIAQDLQEGSALLSNMQAAVASRLAQCPALTPELINSQVGLESYPPVRRPCPHRPWQEPAMQLSLRKMWKQRRFALDLAKKLSLAGVPLASSWLCRGLSKSKLTRDAEPSFCSNCRKLRRPAIGGTSKPSFKSHVTLPPSRCAKDPNYGATVICSFRLKLSFKSLLTTALSCSAANRRCNLPNLWKLLLHFPVMRSSGPYASSRWAKLCRRHAPQ